MKIKVFQSVPGIVLGAALSFLCACARIAEPIFPQTVPDDGARVSVRVLFPTGEADGTPTRSCWTGSPDRVDSFVLMAYRDGCLDAWVFASAKAAASISLFKDQVYQLYALANVPDFVPPLNELEMAGLSLPVGDFQQASILPMACRVDAFVPSVSGQTLTLTFERLFARLVLHLDKGEWGMLRVGSVRLRQAAAYLHPFAHSDVGFSDASSSAGGPDPSDASSVFMDGDAASETDLLRLNAGDSLVLYVPQNRQGTLLPGNDDPYRRVPDALGEKADRCTYLELSASPEGETLLTGDALCRIYLGRNAADNFDVSGNAILDVSVFLTERMMGGWGWRIESRLSWQSGAVTGWLAEGMHPLDDLYVGEVFRYAVQPSEAFLGTIGGDFSRCSLRFGREAGDSPLPAEADTTLIFSEWTPSEAGIWYADVHCRKPVDAGSIRLFLDGNELFNLTDNLVIRLPDYSFPNPPDVSINADTLTLCPLDICDRQGRSLTAAYGFDGDLFRPYFSLAVESDADTDADARSDTEAQPTDLSDFSQWTTVPPSASAPFGACAVGIFHTGSRPEVARFLTESLQKEGPIRLQVQDGRYPIEASRPLRTDMLPVEVRLTDGGSAESSWRLCVNNPSRLPMDWGLVFLPSGWVENPYVEPPAICRTLRVICGVSDLFLVKRVKVLSEQVRDTLSLAVSVATMRSHCQSCACHFDAVRWVGVEPGLHYGACCDRRLDGKIEMSCTLSVSEPDCGLFASSSESWSRNQAHSEPLWLRYSAYDDIGSLQITSGMLTPDLIPTVSFNTDKEDDEHRFQLSYNGSIDGYVWIERSSAPNVAYDISKTFRSYSDRVPADGRTYLCSGGNFAARCQEILQMGLGVENARYYPLLQTVDYAVSLAYQPLDRIFAPEYAGSLYFLYYNRWMSENRPVSATMTAGAERRLFLFE